MTTLAAVPAFAQQPAPLWTGFYAGAHAGLTQYRSTFADGLAPYFLFPPQDYSASGSGLLGGLHAGYNWQSGALVFGVEIDASGMAARTSFAQPAPRITGLGLYSGRINATTTARLRGGVAFGNALIYVTAGGALGHIRNSIVNALGTPVVPFQRSGWRPGWVAGGGVEYAISPAWSVRAEALHMQFSSANGAITVGGPYQFGFRDSATLFRTGFNVRF